VIFIKNLQGIQKARQQEPLLYLALHLTPLPIGAAILAERQRALSKAEGRWAFIKKEG